MMMLVLSAVAIFWAGVAALAAFAVQLIVLSLTERRFRSLRWVTLAVPAAALACGALAQSVIWLGAAGSLLLGWGLGWALYRFQNRRKKP